MSRAALLLTVLLVSGCSLTATDRAERLIRGYDAAAALYGMSLEQLRLTDGVVVSGDPGADIDCLDSCSSTTVTVTGPAATQGRPAWPRSWSGSHGRSSRNLHRPRAQASNRTSATSRPAGPGLCSTGVVVVVRIVQQPTGGYSAWLGQ